MTCKKNILLIYHEIELSNIALHSIHFLLPHATKRKEQTKYGLLILTEITEKKQKPFIKILQIETWWMDYNLHFQGVMYGVWGLRLGPKFEMWPAAERNLYLRIEGEKIRSFAAFTKKYLEPHGWNGANFAAVAKCTN